MGESRNQAHETDSPRCIEGETHSVEKRCRDSNPRPRQNQIHGRLLNEVLAAIGHDGKLTKRRTDQWWRLHG